MVPAPRPANFRLLGLASHPPPRGPFQTAEPPHYDTRKLVAAFEKVLTSVSKRHADNAVPRIVFRKGHRVESKAAKGRRPKTPYYSFDSPEVIFSAPFNRARLIYPDKRPIPAARAYVPEFLEDFFYEDQGERDSRSGEYYYIVQLGIALQSKRSGFREPKVNAREWARRYNASRGKTRKPRQVKRKIKRKTRKRKK
jgi:hypothetical protein